MLDTWTILKEVLLMTVHTLLFTDPLTIRPSSTILRK